MSYLTEIQDRVIAAVRFEPLTVEAIAFELEEPPYRIRGELGFLKRERLVVNRFDPEGYLWELTDRGQQLVAAGDQTELSL